VNEIAAWQDGGWVCLVPDEGWLTWVKEEARLCVWIVSA